MPGLVVFRRRWSVGSDDLVVPGAFLLTIHILWVLRLRFPVNFFERQFYFLIVLTKYTVNYRDVMQKMFTLCYDFQVVNANIIVDHPRLGVSMFSYRLFTETACRVIQPELFFRFKDGIARLKRLFPQKLRNFYGCPMRVTSRNSPPILAFEGNFSNPKSKGNWDNLSGIEGSVFKFVAQELNFTIDLLPFPKSPSSVDNSTLNGCFSELIADRADIAIGAFSASDNNRWRVSPTQCYHSTPYMYVVRGERSLSALERLRKPFAHGVWVFIGFLLTAGAVVIFLVRCMRPTVRRFVFGGTHVTPMRNMFGVILGYPIVRPPRGAFARYILTLWLLLTLVIRNAYQGALYDAFRLDKFVWTPAGYEDLVNWNYDIIVSSDMAQSNTLPTNRTTILLGGNYVQRFQLLEQRRRKYATVALRDSYIHYMSKVYRFSDLVMINEVIYMYQIVMYLPKHSIYVPAINKMLSAFAYSGMGRSISAHSRSHAAMLRRFKEKPPKRPLSMVILKGPFKVYLALHMVALIVFGFELVSFYWRPLRVALEWMN